MNDSATGVSRVSALHLARGEYDVARLVHVHLPDGAAQINRHLRDCWQALLSAVLLHPGSGVALEGAGLRERLAHIPADKMKILSDTLGTTWQDKLGDLLENPSKVESSPEILVATHKILNAASRDLEGPSGTRMASGVRRVFGPLLVPLVIMFATLYLARAWKMMSHNPTDWFSLDADRFRILRSEQAWGALRIDTSVTGKPLIIKGNRYEKGLGSHATSSIEIKLSDSARQFYGACGVDGGTCTTGTIKCAIRSGGKVLFESGLVRGNEPAKEFMIPVDGGSTLTLEALDGGDGNRCDHVDWVNLRVISR